jgi:phage anti-repressor protein
MIAVNVNRGIVGGVECDVVDGRELHAKIGTKAEFRNWIKDRIGQLNFVENQHFEKYGQISSKPGRPPVQYRLTLVAAKKIAMAEHTDAGGAVRDYFIECERIALTGWCASRRNAEQHRGFAPRS